MRHRFCQWNQGLCMALAACLVLCLGPGADAIKCKRCRAKNDEICRSRKKSCENTHVDAVCMVGRKYIDDSLKETFMKCAVDDLHCGAEATVPEDRFRLEINCCSDKDFCSDDM